jgi:phage shock protein C
MSYWQNRYDGNPNPPHGREYRILRGLRRDPINGKVSGVCAGIAGYYGISTWVVRGAALVGLVMNPVLALIVYGVATMMLKPIERAEMEAATATADNAAPGDAPGSDLPPELRFAALREKFNDLMARAGSMEAEVTSKEFNLRRDFRRMGEA